MALDAAGLALRTRLLEVFGRPVDEPLDDTAFDDLARSVFTWQFERNTPLAAWCRRRGIAPARIERWIDIPAVPTAAFKEVPLIAGDVADALLVFRTSGTTAGAAHRGEHLVLDPSIYRAALRPVFEGWLLPAGERMRMLSLLPPAHELPDSSLAFMIDDVMGAFGAPGSAAFARRASGLDTGGLARALEGAVRAGEPVCLLGTSLSFVHWLDALDAENIRLVLPAGSRLMDTGGYKGSTRRVDPDALRARYGECLGIPAGACINEYGMTEMTSQFYDSTLRSPGPRRKVPPPWVRTVVVDPDSLSPLEHPTQPGLLRHVDLANLGSVAALQTEDIGMEVENGFQVLGRVAGAQPRGCSIAMDELLSATRRRP